MNEVSSFIRAATGIFQDHVRSPGRTREEQASWYESYHCKREVEHRDFCENFLEKPDVGILRLTGQIGSGKTTFLLSKLENPKERVCEGFWIDLGKFARVLYRTESEAILEYSKLIKMGVVGERPAEEWISDQICFRLDKIVAQAVEKRFRKHFWWVFTGLPKEYFDVDVWNRFEVQCQGPSQSDLELQAANIRRKVAAALILVRPDYDSVSARAAAFTNAHERDLESRRERHQSIVEFLDSNPDEEKTALETKDIPGSPSMVNRWLRAYCSFFLPKNPIIAFDNIDRLNSPEIQAAVIDYARALAHELRHDHAGASAKGTCGGKFPGEIKVAYAVRDWNLRNNPPSYTDDHVREHKILLGPESMDSDNRPSTPTFLPLNKDHLRRILMARCDRIQEGFQDQNNVETIVPDLGKVDSLNNGSEESTKNKSQETVIETKGNMVGLCEKYREVIIKIWDANPTKDEQFPVEELCNHSIRRALSFAAGGAEKVLSTYMGDIDLIDKWLEKPYRIAVRPLVIDWLFDSEDTDHKFRDFIREEMTLVQGENKPESLHLCCAHRLVLTYLANKWDEGCRNITSNCFVEPMVDHISKYSGLSEGRIRGALRHLFEGVNRQADFVTIYQQGRMRNDGRPFPRHARVHINPRGRAFLQRIVPREEYWSLLHGEGYTYQDIYLKTPEAACEVFRQGIKMIEVVAQAHLRNWKELVNTKFTTLSDGDRPFEFFEQKGLTYGKVFFMERVANSHWHYVTGYLGEVLCGGLFEFPDAGNPQEALWNAVDGVTIPATGGRLDEWKMVVERYCSQVSEFEAKVFRDIFEIGERFHFIRDHFLDFAKLSVAEVRGVDVDSLFEERI